jgi:hypothetical protein
MYRYLFIILSLVVYSNALTQQDFTCPSDSMLDERLKNEPQFRNVFIHGFQQNRDYSEIEHKTIPVVYHVCHFDGTDSISVDSVLNRHNTLNISFDGLWFEEEYDFMMDPPNGLDSKIDFCVVNEVDSYGSNLGIQYHNLLNYEWYDNTLKPWVGINLTNFNELKVTGAINVFIGEFNMPGYAGASTGMGVFMKTFYTQVNGVLVHEIGHQLGLRHTFYGYDHDCSLALSETDCTSQSDLVCDTPPTVINWTCDTLLCDGQVENVKGNFMGWCGIKNYFTEGQIERMHWYIEEFNPYGILDGLSMCHYHPCVWDLNNDGIVALQDLIQFLSVFNTSVEVHEGDFNISGTADMNDLLELLSYYTYNCVTQELDGN